MTRWGGARARAFVIGGCLAAALLALAAPALADDSARINLLEENDSLYFNSDKHYTQGLRLSYLSPNVKPDTWSYGLFGVFGLTSDSPADQISGRRFAFMFGQSIFTPKNTSLSPPDPTDRPYAGWAYVGGSLLQETNRRMLENLEVQLGVVGPAALGKEVQNDFHQLIGKEQAQGWGSQLQNEPGLVISYDRHWRVPLIGDGHMGADVVPEAGATIGNVFDYVEAGGLFRVGKNLEADYGAIRIRPSLSGTDYFNGDDLDDGFGFAFFAGAQGRAVARNIFLDGNTFRDSRSVDKKPLVADLQAGFSIFGSRSWRVDFSVVRRTEEYRGQGSPDVIGTADLSFSW
jgi:lipid A 3-O-deacylase